MKLIQLDVAATALLREWIDKAATFTIGIDDDGNSEVMGHDGEVVKFKADAGWWSAPVIGARITSPTAPSTIRGEWWRQ